ncbi:MAG: endonuclease/exonuclease/phosphatase family protein [Candidatus Magasanikbacteria bacterium]|nr:endonuclease/exonuclease/phosphatase family protein [Candidatus Magasanikbacteria bacterium]
MKLISLNTYGGRFFEPIMEFIKQNSADTDIFCFQELLHNEKDMVEVGLFRANFFSEISRALPEFTGTFAPVQPGVYPHGDTTHEIAFGLGILINKKFSIKNSGNFFIVGNELSYITGQVTTLPYKAQFIQLSIEDKSLTVCNVHGTAFPSDKLDNPARLEQSKKILDFIASQDGEKIITGDFNLFPETDSIKIFEKERLNNLVKDFNIKTTRGSLIKKLHPEYIKPDGTMQEFADYTFISSGIKPTNYTVPDLPISDHLPLILEFKI